MKLLYILASLSLFVTFTFAQKSGREQKIQTIFDLRSQISAIEKEILLPDAADIETAEKIGAAAIRILPREKYDSVLAIRGGGAYYSFVRKTNEYGYGSDIQLGQGNLSVGFAGADYGFLKDLGVTNLSEVTRDTGEVGALMKYSPPSDESAIRAEFYKLRSGYELNGVSFTSQVAAIVGHSYILRSISIDRSDILVGFSVFRKDPDGSLILFWKTLEAFPKPAIQREKTAIVQ